MSEALPRYHLVIPAAGVGRRFGGQTAKQYQTINGKTLLEYSIRAGSAAASCASVTVALSAQDSVFQPPEIACPLYRVEGGQERSDSVLNALHAMSHRVESDDLILVHDAARPYLPLTDLQTLLRQAVRSQEGAILASPVADTLKRVHADRVEGTVDRAQIWRALTPQAAPFAVLVAALENAADKGLVITDEASALEHAGLSPLVVEGSTANIKVTYPQDLTVVSHYLSQQN